jgi:hypothetical protein
MTPPYRLAPLEIASGLVFGRMPYPRDRAIRARETPIGALERAVLDALEHPPCLVSFSGGRDSSGILAVTTHVARREGLPLPVPATNRFRGDEHTGEARWQERVVSHLGLRDWFRNDVNDELDCVGPVATEKLLRHGLLWPFNAHFHVPLLAAARGGTLLTGVGGDEALSPSRWLRATEVMQRRTRPTPRDVLPVSLALSPRPLRAIVVRRRLDASFPWLRPSSAHRVLDAWAREGASEPLRWSARYRWWRSLRYLQIGQQSLGLLAADEGVRIAHPFASAPFLDALGVLGSDVRFHDRTAAMTMLFGDLLPREVLGRTSKANYDNAFFNRHSRHFIGRLQGRYGDLEHVDAVGLRRTWSEAMPDPRSFLLLQAVWLSEGATDLTH